MNHSCINCKYKYEPISISDYYEKTLHIPGCDWSDPNLKHLFWLCSNENYSPIIFVNNKPQLHKCISFNSFGTCPFFKTSDAINIEPIQFSIPEPEKEFNVGDKITISVKQDKPTDSADTFTPPEPPKLPLTFKYQWFKNGRKLFKEKKDSLLIEAKEPSETYYHCVVTESIEDNGDGGVKVSNIQTNSVKITILPVFP